MSHHHYLLSFAFLTALTGCTREQVIYELPQFDSFSYTGNDQRYRLPIDVTTQYLNPVISGCNPDPSICRVGADFYMANSSFVYWPGIPVWHSRDLIDWDLTGYVITRPSQANFAEGIRIDGGVYAPDIKYCPQNETFYLIVTLVDCGGNVIYKSKNPYEGWSEPIPVPEVHGIDPSFLFDTDGRCYIVNNDEPAYPAEYSGHRAIWCREFDLATDKVCSEARVLIDKGIHPEENPIWIEGPHLYHIGSQYYLMDAEGGTGDNHSEVILAGKSPYGPFAPCAQNPILTQRTQPHDRVNPVACAGHADMLQVPDSITQGEAEWWSVFLACTTYDGDKLYNTGRSTFLLPTSWQQDAVSRGVQPLILHPDSVIPTICSKSAWQQTVAETRDIRLGSKSDPRNLLTGNGTYTDDFDGDSLHPLWITLRTPQDTTAWYTVADGYVTLTPRADLLSGKGQPSLLGRWVKNDTYTVETTMRFTPAGRQKAGLTLFQSENGHILFCKTVEEGRPAVSLFMSDKDHKDLLIASTSLSETENAEPIVLRAAATGHTITFSYSLDGGKGWITLAENVGADILTTSYAGGFTGCVAGIFATK